VVLYKHKLISALGNGGVLPSRGSEHEEIFAYQLKDNGLLDGCERQYRFHPSRKWSFDFAWPSVLVAVEVEGGVWIQGRHTRGAGFVKDCEKYGEAAILGWLILRIPAAWVDNGTGLGMLTRLMNNRPNKRQLNAKKRSGRGC